VGFREGLRVGADVLELEVHLTADGHLVVIHDDTVDRTTDGTGLVREMTLHEVKGSTPATGSPATVGRPTLAGAKALPSRPSRRFTKNSRACRSTSR
jgi:glycerophosphoryl diester phosphodiesterase